MDQELIHKAVYEFGLGSFVGIRQATLYTIQFCCKASFTQVKWLILGRVTKKKNLIKIYILENRKCFVHPNSLQNEEKLCLVSLFVCYLSLRYKLPRGLC